MTTLVAELISQHDGLREMMDHCDDLADSLDGQPDGDPGPLVREIARLREAFEAHNKFEEQLLRPILLAHDTYGTTRVERMVEDHVHEHDAVRQRLSAPATAAIRDVIDTLRAHLDAEERYLLTSKVLRADLANPAASSAR
jgi:iron-sulfur cluster repair protein YtfE (RIC family)